MNPQSAALFLDDFFRAKDKKKVLQKYMTAKNKKGQRVTQD
jgi:hypothetical protein